MSSSGLSPAKVVSTRRRARATSPACTALARARRSSSPSPRLWSARRSRAASPSAMAWWMSTTSSRSRQVDSQDSSCSSATAATAPGSSWTKRSSGRSRSWSRAARPNVTRPRWNGCSSAFATWCRSRWQRPRRPLLQVSPAARQNPTIPNCSAVPVCQEVRANNSKATPRASRRRPVWRPGWWPTRTIGPFHPHRLRNMTSLAASLVSTYAWAANRLGAPRTRASSAPRARSRPGRWATATASRSPISKPA